MGLLSAIVPIYRPASTQTEVFAITLPKQYAYGFAPSAISLHGLWQLLS